jgi:hypothetical protein
VFRFKPLCSGKAMLEDLLKGLRILVTGVTLYPQGCENLLIIGAITAHGLSKGSASMFSSPKEAVGKENLPNWVRLAKRMYPSI